MATSSIIETVCISDKKKIERFVRALESAKDTRPKPVTYSRSVQVVSEETEIRKMFPSKDDARV